MVCLAWICTLFFLVLHSQWSMFDCLTYAPLSVKVMSYLNSPGIRALPLSCRYNMVVKRIDAVVSEYLKCFC